MKKIYIKIAFVIMWMILIFLLSNDPAIESSKLSNGFIRGTISKVIHDDSETTIEKFTKPVRKAAHFFIYLVLGVLVFNCFKLDQKYVIYSIVICLIYAISDEIHQFFIDGRSAEIFDVMIDTLGSSIGILFEYFVKNKISKK